MPRFLRSSENWQRLSAHVKAETSSAAEAPLPATSPIAIPHLSESMGTKSRLTPNRLGGLEARPGKPLIEGRRQ